MIRAKAVGFLVVVCVYSILATNTFAAQADANWKPPGQVDKILHYMIQNEIKFKLETHVDKTKKAIDINATNLGRKIYETGITEERLETLVAEVIRENGHKNPEVNYEKDLLTVVKKATDTLIVNIEPSVIKEYIRKDILQKLLKAVATKGMQEVAHLVTVASLADVYEEAHKNAVKLFQAKVEQAKSSKRKIKDANLLWTQILHDEYIKAARNWILAELHKNWGVELGYQKPEKQVEQAAQNRANQLPKADTELPDFIAARLRAIYDDAKARGLTSRQRTKIVEDFYDTLKDGASKKFSRKEKKEFLSQVEDLKEQQERLAEDRKEFEAARARLAQDQEELPIQNKQQNQQGGHRTAAAKPTSTSSTKPLTASQPNRRPNRVVPSPPPTVAKSRQYAFLIDLEMKSRSQSVIDVSIHLCKVDSEEGIIIEKQNVMATQRITVERFSRDDMDRASKAIQTILEAPEGVNRCVDEAQILAMRASGARTTPPVQLNCYLRKDHKYMANVWNEAVKLAVRTTAGNDWTGVSIRFVKTLEEST